ncbi:MAG: thermonuclease family protein [Rhodospirillaceae bacterium]|nr:thermonuclease family protein [Rhodospirillaceae bacterium]
MLRLPTAIILMSLVAGSAQGTDVAAFTGKVEVVQDGETFSLVGGQKIRIFGLDAPGLRQRCQQNAVNASRSSPCIPCGQSARRALEDLILGKEVRCERRGESDGQMVGECAYGRVKIGPWMLAHGYGVVDGEYMERRDLKAYVGTQRAAKEANTGLWAMSFIPPADWRNHKQRLECER